MPDESSYFQSILPVPSFGSNSVLSQSLIQVTFCTEIVWFRANSVIHSEFSSDSEEYRIFSLNFALIQINSEITSQLVLKSSDSALNHEISLKLFGISAGWHWTVSTGMSRPSLTKNLTCRLLRVHVRLFSEIYVFKRFLCFHQIFFLRLISDFRVFNRFSCLRKSFVRSPDFLRSFRRFCAFRSRNLWVHRNFVRLTDFCSFMSRVCVLTIFLCVLRDLCPFFSKHKTNFFACFFYEK